MPFFPYQIGLLGDVSEHEQRLRKTIEKQILSLGLDADTFLVLSGHQILSRDRRGPFAAIFFGYSGVTLADEPALADILDDSGVVLPVVPDLSQFSHYVPAELRHINGIELDEHDTTFERVATFLLETFRLLRRERRLFISYKRTDCAFVAGQLYDELDRRGFDVFIDTRGVPPGKDFQSILWHRLADSDVVVVLDTPNFFESRWTEAEVARANTTSIQLLQVLWPGRSAVPAAALSTFFPLSSADFGPIQIGDDAELAQATVQRIATTVEGLRSRALADRHRYLVNAFCDHARDLGLSTELQPTRHILLRGKKGSILVIPLVGVPSALRMHEIHDEVGADKHAVIWVVYDSRGLLEEAILHLEWLNVRLPLKALKVTDVSNRLKLEQLA
jgi:hypothetical protein